MRDGRGAGDGPEYDEKKLQDRKRYRGELDANQFTVSSAKESSFAFL